MVEFVFEHLEPDLSEWAKAGLLVRLTIEYSHASKILGHANMSITNFKCQDFARHLGMACVERTASEAFDHADVCLLDSTAKETLSPEDAAKFRYFLIGGILGNGIAACLPFFM